MERIAMPYSDSMSFLMYVSEITKIIKATKLLPYHPVYIQIPRRLKEKYEDDMKRSADIQMAMNEKEISEKKAEKQTTKKKMLYYIKGTEPSYDDTLLDSAIPTIKMEE